MAKRKKKKLKKNNNTKNKKSLSKIIYEIYAKIRLWIQPYWQPKYDVYSDTKVKKKPKKKKKKKKVKEKHWTEYLEGTENHDTYCKVITYPEEIVPFGMDIQPAYDNIWCFHSRDLHQVYGHFKPKAGFRFKTRSNKKRRQLKPLIFPIQNKPFDRTHLIPIGYHNSENDKRLLIGWDSKDNRGPFNKFEQKQKKRSIPIYWFTEVKKSPAGAVWTYKIFSEDGTEIDSYSKERLGKFVWHG